MKDWELIDQVYVVAPLEKRPKNIRYLPRVKLITMNCMMGEAYGMVNLLRQVVKLVKKKAGIVILKTKVNRS